MKSIEIFAGVGGLGMGLHGAGFQPICVVERDRWCCDTISENKKRGVIAVKRWKLIAGDIRNVDLCEFKGKVALLSGGPPCQPFSMGGKHLAYDDDRDMFPHAIRAVRQTSPKAFIFENVRGLTRINFRNYFEYIRLQMTYPEIEVRREESWTDHLARLESHHMSGSRSGLVYRLVTKVVDAADYGIPQRRHRVFFVGFRDDTNVDWHFPSPTHCAESLEWDKAHGDYWDRHKVANKDRLFGLSPSQVRPELLPWLSVRDAISDLPDPEKSPLLAATIHNHRFQPGARSYPGHTGSHLDGPAKAIKSGVHGVPGGENMILRPNGAVRYFTVRESARLQTFPDDFVFHGAWSESMRQLGNAVPVELARFVGESIARRID